MYDATPERHVAGQALFSVKKQFRIKVIHYAEICTEHQTTQMLTVGSSSAPEQAGGSDSVSLAVAARQICGAAGSGNKRLYTATFSEALLRANTPIKTSASLSRAPVCDATNTLVEDDPNFSAVNIEAIYLSETFIPIHTALLTYHNVY
jgi:hypothetical protein